LQFEMALFAYAQTSLAPQRGKNSPKNSRIEPLNRSSRRKEAQTLFHEIKIEPPYVGCYQVQGEGGAYQEW